MGRLHHIATHQHVMSGLLVQQLQYSGIPESGAWACKIISTNATRTTTHLIFSSSRFEKNTLRRSVTIGSSYFLSISLPAEYLSSNLDQATRTAYGRWCGFNWISVGQKGNISLVGGGGGGSLIETHRGEWVSQGVNDWMNEWLNKQMQWIWVTRMFSCWFCGKKDTFDSVGRLSSQTPGGGSQPWWWWWWFCCCCWTTPEYEFEHRLLT